MEGRKVDEKFFKLSEFNLGQISGALCATGGLFISYNIIIIGLLIFLLGISFSFINAYRKLN